MISGPANVIVCDDHALARQTVTAVLEREGYRVVGASTVGDCLREIARAHPDLVVMDLRVGEASGLAAIEEIRGDPEIASTPVLLLSGEPLEAISNLTERTGADAFLAKPFEIAEFVETVKTLIERGTQIVGWSSSAT